METFAPGIALRRSFLPEASCDAAVRAAERLEWVKADLGHYRDDRLVDRRLDLTLRDVEVARFPASFDSIHPGYEQAVGQVIETDFDIVGLTIGSFVMSRYVPGCHIKAHSDTGVNSTSRVLTCVQYFNGDFEGGELQFPDVNVTLRPSAGDLVVFRSEYKHAVSQITAGVRYCMIFFGSTPALFSAAFKEQSIISLDQN